MGWREAPGRAGLRWRRRPPQGAASSQRVRLTSGLLMIGIRFQNRRRRCVSARGRDRDPPGCALENGTKELAEGVTEVARSNPGDRRRDNPGDRLKPVTEAGATALADGGRLQPASWVSGISRHATLRTEIADRVLETSSPREAPSRTARRRRRSGDGPALSRRGAHRSPRAAPRCGRRSGAARRAAATGRRAAQWRLGRSWACCPRSPERSAGK